MPCCNICDLNSKLLTMPCTFNAGGTASVYVGQPLDTVKVKMQTFPTLHTNAYRCFMTTLRQEGIAHGLYAGTVPSLAAQVIDL